MHLINFIQKNVFSLLKLVGAVIILYLGLNYAVLPVGEDFSKEIYKDYLNEQDYYSHEIFTGNIQQYIDEAFQELQFLLTGETHGVAIDDTFYQKRFSLICESNLDLCNLIRWVGDFSRKEKYLYISCIFNIVNFIQKHKIVGMDMISVLREIVVDSNSSNKRGYATWNTIVFTIGSVESRSEFIGLSTHELGHVYDLGSLQGVYSDKHSAFTEFGKQVFSLDDPSLDYYALSRKSETVRKSGASKKDFCSGYGMSDPFEDFAECFNLYINYNSIFKAMAKNNQILKKKYNFIASLFDGKFLYGYDVGLDVLKKSSDRRPWDTTKIID